MSGFGNFLSGIGAVGNAAGVQGPDDMGGLNAMQRAGMAANDPGQYAAMEKQSALAKLASDPQFQQLPPADQQAAIVKVTGNPADAQKVSALSQLAKMSTSNPASFVNQGVQNGTVQPENALTYLANPNVQANAVMGGMNQPPAPGAGPGTAPPPPLAGVGGGNGTPYALPTPSAAAPAGPGAASGNQPQNSTTPGINWDTVNKYKQQSPLIGNMAESILLGTFNPESGKGENDPTFNAALAVANQADPTLRGNYLSRAKMTQNITSGDMYKQQTNLNAAVSHVYDLHQMADNLGNADDSRPIVNGMGNAISSEFAKGGNPNVSRYQSTLSSAAPEVDKYLSGGSPTVSGTKEIADNYSPSLPTKTIKQNALDLSAKAMVKGQALQNEYNTAMGAASNRSVVQPETAALYKDMQGTPLTLQEQQLVNDHRKVANLPPKKWGAQQTASKPVPLSVPPTAAQPPVGAAPVTPGAAPTPAAPAPKIAEGQTATNPQTGHKMVYRGGQWGNL